MPSQTAKIPKHESQNGALQEGQSDSTSAERNGFHAAGLAVPKPSLPHEPAANKSPNSESDTTLSRLVEKALRTWQVIAAVSQVGVVVASKAAELYQVWSKPILRVHGNGHKNMPGSVAALARDLRKRTVFEAHQAALQATLKLNANFERKLQYGEYVYRMSRKPRARIPRKSLLVIRDVHAANPNDVQFLIEKAKRAKAKIVLVDCEWPRAALVEQAKSMRPGERKHLPNPEIDR